MRTRLNDEEWSALRDAARGMLAQHVPEWTDQNAHDPGLALVELFAFLGENLLARAQVLPERERSRLAAVLARLERLGADTPALRVARTRIDSDQ